MEKETTQEKACENCSYYSAHYIKENTRYRKISCGICLNTHKRKPVLCGYWEDAQMRKGERKKSITKTLESMAQHIEEIALILKEEI